MASCASKQPITKSLYEQSGRAHIYLPTKAEGASMLTERATIETRIDTIRRETVSQPVDSSSITLDTFVVVADRPRVRISTVRNGYVNLSFLVTLPKAFMDERWQVSLMPILLNGDERVPLAPLVVQGKAFRAQQEQEYKQFEDFRNGIVDSAEYSSKFFDGKRHKAFITDLQKMYFKSYRRELSRFRGYDRWRRIMEQRQILFEDQAATRYDRKASAEGLYSLRKAYDINLRGGDSTLVRALYRDYYTPERRLDVLGTKARAITSDQVPDAYRDFFDHHITAADLRNLSITERDSMNVAQYTYNEKAIVTNESKRDNLETYRRHLIKLNQTKEPHAVLDATPGSDLVYMYSRDIPVNENLKRKLQLTLDTHVFAIDQSSWWQAGIDTLNFVISGINDLMDKSLIERLEGDARAEYQQGLDRLTVYDYKGALDILNRYPDFNSAICLAALGQNRQTIMLLDKLQPTSARMNYLRAIVYARDKHMEHARYYLIEGVKREMQLAYKAELEPEFSELFVTYPTLTEELRNLADEVEEF